MSMCKRDEREEDSPNAKIEFVLSESSPAIRIIPADYFHPIPLDLTFHSTEKVLMLVRVRSEGRRSIVPVSYCLGGKGDRQYQKREIMKQ